VTHFVYLGEKENQLLTHVQAKCI